MARGALESVIILLSILLFSLHVECEKHVSELNVTLETIISLNQTLKLLSRQVNQIHHVIIGMEETIYNLQTYDESPSITIQEQYHDLTDVEIFYCRLVWGPMYDPARGGWNFTCKLEVAIAQNPVYWVIRVVSLCLCVSLGGIICILLCLCVSFGGVIWRLYYECTVIDFDLIDDSIEAQCKKVESAVECPICYEDQTEIFISKCKHKHLFCKECISKWINASGSTRCPFCTLDMVHCGDECEKCPRENT